MRDVLPPLTGRSLERATREDTTKIVAAIERTADSWLASLPDAIEREILRERLMCMSPLERLVALKWCPVEAAYRALMEEVLPMPTEKPRSLTWPYIY